MRCLSLSGHVYHVRHTLVKLTVGLHSQDESTVAHPTAVVCQRADIPPPRLPKLEVTTEVDTYAQLKVPHTPSRALTHALIRALTYVLLAL